MKKELANSIVDLKILSSRICEGEGENFGVFTTKFQILYLLSKKDVTCPKELSFALSIAKSNLAGICNEMQRESLIAKTKDGSNKKEIYYIITGTGKQQLSAKIKAIENVFKNDLKVDEALDSLKKTIDILKGI